MYGRQRRHRIRSLIGLGLAAGLTLVTACGGSSAEDAGTKTLTVSNPANVSNVPLHIAMEQGFFQEEGLTVRADVDLGSGSTVEAVIGGQVDMAWTNVVSAIGVYSKGLGVRMAAVTDTAVPGAQQVLVPKDSPVRSLADLVGKKVAVLSPNTVCILGIRSALNAQGLPADGITFTPVAPPEHANVLESGEVAATCTSDPFRTLMIEKLGARSVLEASTGELSGHPVGGYVVSERFAKENAATLAAFRRALVKAARFANARPDAVRIALPKFAAVDPGIADRVVVNKFVEADPAAIRPELQRIADAMRTYGMVDKPVDVSGFLLTGG